MIDIIAHVKEKTRKHNELVYLGLRGAISTAELTISWLGIIQRLLQWNTNRILVTLIITIAFTQHQKMLNPSASDYHTLQDMGRKE